MLVVDEIGLITIEPVADLIGEIANGEDFRALVELQGIGRGQSLVVWAIREGRQCAREVDSYLMGDSTLPR